MKMEEKQMKKKAILALIAAMTLSMASVGTVFAAVNNGGNGEVREKEEHIHTWGDPFYVKDADAVYDTVYHEAVYSDPYWVVDVPEITEIHTVCYTCGYNFSLNYGPDQINDVILQHAKNHALNGESGAYGSKEVVVQEEQGHYEKDLIQDAWTEDILVTPELGHWAHTCSGCGETQNSETGEVIKPGTLPEEPTEPSEPTEPEQPTDPSQPSEPSNPGTNPGDGETTDPTEPGDNTDNTDNPEDTEKPEDNQNPSEDTEKPEDNQNPSEDNQDTENNQDTVTGTKVEQENTDTTENTGENQETGRKSPKTGDPANLMYLVTLAGSALTGGTVLGFKRRNRK